MQKRIFGWMNEADPSAEEMATLLQQTDKILDELDKKVDLQGIQGRALQGLKSTYESEKRLLVTNTHEIDKDKWKDLGKSKRGNYYADISSIKNALIGLDYPDLRVGRVVFTLFALILLLASVFYIRLHMSPPRIFNPLSDKVVSANILTPSPHNMAVNETKPEAAEKPSSGVSVTPSGAGTSQPTAETIIAIQEKISVLRMQLNKPPSPEEDWKEITGTRNNLSSLIPKERLSNNTLRTLGNLWGALDQKNAEKGKEAIDALEIGLYQDFDDPPANYLWTKGSGKWFEITFWAFFGVLVGLMYYISKRLKEGLFDRQDVTTMAAEALMAPFVACVIFFLLQETGITQISAAGESMFVILGFAFILGYAIRRTVGLLDNLKRRFLPDP